MEQEVGNIHGAIIQCHNMKISLNNFLRMNPEVPQYSTTNQHYLLSGVNPTYYNDVPGIQEEQLAPLAASSKWFDMGGGSFVFGSPTSDITDSTEGTYSAYSIDNNSEVYGIDIFTNNVVPLGYPSGSIETSFAQKLKCYNNKLLAITKTTTSPNMWKMDLPSGSWSSFGTISANDEHFLENFLEYCMVSDSYSKVKKIDASFSILTGIDLGTGWTIKGMKNLNDKYLAVVGANGNFTNNFLFLWNGRDDRYNYSVKIPGKYIDMKVIDGVLYVAIWANGTGNGTNTGKTALYSLNGTRLTQIMIPQVSAITTSTGQKGAIFNFMNKVGLRLDSTELMVYAKTIAGIEEFVLSRDINFNKFIETYDGYLLGTAPVTGQATGTCYWYNAQSTSYHNISYKSQWIPLPTNATGLDIVYDTPPQSGSDAINVTVYGKGENIISGNSTTVLNSITASSVLNTTRTRLDLQGFTGDKIMVQLTTVNTTWRPIIREINIITE